MNVLKDSVPLTLEERESINEFFWSHFEEDRPPMISEDELKQLEELEKNATFGLWVVENDIHIKSTDEMSDGTISPSFDNICTLQVSNCPNFKDDAEFIVYSRNLLPRLLEGYREMSGVIDNLMPKAIAEVESYYLELQSQLSQKDATIAKMREYYKEQLANKDRMIDDLNGLIRGLM